MRNVYGERIELSSNHKGLATQISDKLTMFREPERFSSDFDRLPPFIDWRESSMSQSSLELADSHVCSRRSDSLGR